MFEKHETFVDGQRLLLTEHHGKCLTCRSFVTLWVLSSFSVSLSLCLTLCVCLCLFVLCVVVVLVMVEGGEEERGRD